MAKAKRRMLLAHREERMRQEIANFFEKNDYTVYTSTNGKDAVDMFYSNNHQIDIVILDEILDTYSGMKAVEMIREYSEVPILLLAKEFSEETLVDALSKDVDHYIIMPLKMSTLKAFADKVLRRQRLFSEEELVHGVLRIDQTAQKAYLKELELDLTPKEYALINYFMQHKNVLLTREAILNAVWGFDYQGDMRTVDTLIKQLRKKLTYAHPYIQSIYGVGYRFEESSVEVEDKK